MFLQYFKIKRNNYKKQTSSIYQEIVNHSNHFIKNSLNDKDFNFDEVFEIFSIITVFYLTRKNRRNTSAYSYECKLCTIKRILKTRKVKNKKIDWEYPDW